jgi:hypothetical protein
MAVNFNPRSATVLLDQLDMLLQGACVSEQLGAVLAHYYDVVRVAWNMWTFEVFVAGSVMLAVVGWRVGRGAADGTIPVRQRAASVAVSKWLSSLVSIGLLCVMWTGFALFVWIGTGTRDFDMAAGPGGARLCLHFSWSKGRLRWR